MMARMAGPTGEHRQAGSGFEPAEHRLRTVDEEVYAKKKPRCRSTEAVGS